MFRAAHYHKVTLSLPMPWIRRRSLPSEDRHAARLREVYHAMRSSTRYGQSLDLGESAKWADVPSIDLLEFLCHTDRYTDAGARSANREELVYPAGRPPRTAVVGRDVSQTWRVRTFRSLSDEKLWRFKPHAIAAPVDSLRCYAQDAGAAPLRNAVIAFSDILQGPLSFEDSDRLWAAYQVPVFEQFLGLDGELLAWECEIHHGLHVREDAALFETLVDERLMISFLANPRLPLLRLETGLAGRIVKEPCPCGVNSPRIVDLHRRPMKRRIAAHEFAVAAVG